MIQPKAYDLILRTRIGTKDGSPVIAEIWLLGKPSARNLRALRRALDLTVEAFEADETPPAPPTLPEAVADGERDR